MINPKRFAWFCCALSVLLLLCSACAESNVNSWTKRVIFPVLDILAGIPSVVFGVWGTLIIVPWIADKLGPHFVEYTSGYTVLASGIVLGVMILPILVRLLLTILRKTASVDTIGILQKAM